jgi:hypothetical protein
VLSENCAFFVRRFICVFRMYGSCLRRCHGGQHKQTKRSPTSNFELAHDESQNLAV